MSEQLRATFVRMFLYETQVDLSKTSSWNIAINEKKKYTSYISNGFKYMLWVLIRSASPMSVWILWVNTVQS